MKPRVVLSHLMSRDCDLGAESIARAKLAIELFCLHKYDLIVTLGWDYRADCAKPIADVMKEYILKNSRINRNSVVSIVKSRDTVGDAFVCLDFFDDADLSSVHVVTSDYHVNRTSVIFNSMFKNSTSVEVHGVATSANTDPSIAQHEERSLEAFSQTFKGVDFSSKKQISDALSERHPFYNGKVHPRISFC